MNLPSDIVEEYARNYLLSDIITEEENAPDHMLGQKRTLEMHWENWTTRSLCLAEPKEESRHGREVATATCVFFIVF